MLQCKCCMFSVICSPPLPQSEDGSAGGFKGGMPSRPSRKRSPAACSVMSRSQQKNFLYLLEEKRGGARKSKIEKKTFLLAGERQRAAAGRSIRRSVQNRFGFRQTNAQTEALKWASVCADGGTRTHTDFSTES